MSTSTPVRDFSAVILGAGGVGKSALTLRYMRGLFNDAYDPTKLTDVRSLLTEKQAESVPIFPSLSFLSLPTLLASIPSLGSSTSLSVNIALPQPSLAPNGFRSSRSSNPCLNRSQKLHGSSPIRQHARMHQSPLVSFRLQRSPRTLVRGPHG
ncbi:hypothetical protein FRC20_011880 [Serendipita sp. 405]|nr:hypothetical protein FRC20_011880 [Serendipita sp. 405]